MPKYSCSAFFLFMCESPKPYKGHYFSCLHVKELKKNKSVNRSHWIGPGKKAQKKGYAPLQIWLTTHVWKFFKIMCESSKPYEGRYFSCFHVKELKKNKRVNRFHRIRPEKKHKNKKNRICTLTNMSKYPCSAFFLCASRLSHTRCIISHVCTSRN